MSLPLRIALVALLVASPLAAQTKPAAKPAAKTAAKPTTKPAPAKPAAPDAPAAKPKPKTKLAPPALNVAEKEGFAVMQVAAGDADKFIAAWKLGNGAKSTSTKTVANQPIFTFLIFHGCKPDPMGKCDIVADFTITRPDGTVNDENKGVTVWNKPPPDERTTPLIGDGALGYGVDDEGPFGDYVIAAAVTDRVAGVTVTTQQTITIAPALPAPKLK